MNSRRFLSSMGPPPKITTTGTDGPGGRSARITIAHHGTAGDLLRCGITTRLMTAAGQTRPRSHVRVAAALPPTKAVMLQAAIGSFVPEPDSGSATNRDTLFDHIV